MDKKEREKTLIQQTQQKKKKVDEKKTDGKDLKEMLKRRNRRLMGMISLQLLQGNLGNKRKKRIGKKKENDQEKEITHKNTKKKLFEEEINKLEIENKDLIDKLKQGKIEFKKANEILEEYKKSLKEYEECEYLKTKTKPEILYKPRYSKEEQEKINKIKEIQLKKLKLLKEKAKRILLVK